MDPTIKTTDIEQLEVQANERTKYKTGENAVIPARNVRLPRLSTGVNRPMQMSKAARRMGRRNARLNMGRVWR